MSSRTEARIRPLEPPFDSDVGALLEQMMPAGVPPITLFRTFARNPAMTEAMLGWGSYELGKRLSLSMRVRELVIDRVTARLGCEYEWGVHVAFFAERVDLTASQLSSITSGSPDDPCWDASDAAVLRLVDSLVDHADVDDVLWERAAVWFTDAQLLDLLLLAGWYHAISFVAKAARVPLEEGAPRFAAFTEVADR